MQSEAEAKACCADLYQSDMAKLIMGDTLHPGGLGLTNKLGRLMGLESGDVVADLASARGESAQALGRVFHCSVVGVSSAPRLCATPTTPRPKQATLTSSGATLSACLCGPEPLTPRSASAP